jgi:competence protein ComER
MNVGFIGTGNMGGVLVHAFIKSNALKPEQILITNRTIKKAEQLADIYPGIQLSRSVTQLAVQCNILFICVKPLEYQSLLDIIAPHVRPEQIIISITSPVLIRHLEGKLPCKIAKIIPSITNYERSGATLCMYGSLITERDKALLESLLCHISTPVRIEERHARVNSDISSIGPAFMAFFVEQLVQAAVEITGISRSAANRLAGEMLLGTGLLLTSGGYSPETLQQRVCVPGGITAKALELLLHRTEGVFLDVIRTTHAKYEEDLNKVEEMMLD